jgi:CRISPR-associated protein Csm4
MELKLAALKMVFHSGVHLGSREGALEETDYFIHSDTLYSAFFHGYRLLYGQESLERMLWLFLEDAPPFLISSAFPFWEGILYLPTPKNQITADKKAKKVVYLDRTSWSLLLTGTSLMEVLSNPDTSTIPRTGITSGSGEDKQPWKLVDAPRVGLDRRTNHPGERYFHCGEVHYEDRSGLYCIVDIRNRDYQRPFEAVWRLLADEGLGGDRTVGKGHFRYPVIEEFSLEVPNDAKGSVAISLYYPSAKERSGFQESAYDLVERRGYIYSPEGQSLRRKTVSMFTEGSVFPSPPERKGALVNVTPSVFNAHHVYRSGIFFGMPCVL